MPGVLPKWGDGPVTRQVNVAITGGQLVMPDAATGKIKPATSATDLCLGVALNDAAPAASGEGTTTYGAPVLDIALPPDYVAVASGCFIKVTYTLAAAFGQKLIIGTVAGTVSPAGAAPDARFIVGRCEEPAGVLAGAKGIAYIY